VKFADKNVIFLVEIDVGVHGVSCFGVLTVEAVMPRWSG